MDVLDKRKELTEVQLRVRDLEKLYREKKEKRALSSIDQYVTLLENNAIVLRVEDMDMNTLKGLVDNLYVKTNQGTIFAASVSSDKVAFLCKTGNPSVHAGNLVKEAAVKCGGNGGGRNDYAQAGAKDVSQVDNALEFVRGKLS